MEGVLISAWPSLSLKAQGPEFGDPAEVEIIFDQNPPVITNAVLNTFYDCATFSAQITGFVDNYLLAGSGDTYQWFLDGSPIPGATEMAVLVNGPGNYTVGVTNEYGCQSISDPYMIIDTGIRENNGPQLILLPNPSSSETVLICPFLLTGQHRITLVDMNGRVIQEWRGNELRSFHIQHGNISPGSYVIRVSGPNGHCTVHAMFIP